MTRRPEVQKLVDTVRDQINPSPVEGRCISCGQPFTSENVFTDAGWSEVAITQLCEKCFDAMEED